jgi:hypothetical protein
LLAVGEDGRDLRHLIAGEAEPFAEVSGLLVRVRGAVLLALLRRRGGLVDGGRLCDDESRSR